MAPLYRETDLGGRLTPFKGIWPKVDDSAFILHGAQVVGDVVIGPGSSIWHNTVVRGDVHHVRIGARSNVQDGTVVHVTTHKNPTLIGDDVLVAHKAMLHGCTLEDGAFVGMGAIVMDRAVVEGGGMLAAGGMLTPGKVIRRGELWAGSPASLMRTLSDAEIAANMRMPEHYRLLAEQHRLDARGEQAIHPYP
ncbi:gamma carbonic anhydrase family protein [Yunchengibacter salinarum]|uniref:gamma carbonic anhydrase family protein n=1 Tax=Yunchengibacter salinarum TaxID=3133399 RepID=UPI0035B60A01